MPSAGKYLKGRKVPTEMENVPNGKVRKEFCSEDPDLICFCLGFCSVVI